jgi:hypothetical protein
MPPEEAKPDDREREQQQKHDEENLRQRLQAAIPELVKRTFFAGLGAVFTTEEGIRKIVSDFSLPKEVASFLVTQAQSTKDELFRVVAGELRGWLDKLDLNRELAKVLTTLSLEVRTEVRFVPNDEALVKPEIKRKVSLKRSKPADDDAEPAEPDRQPAKTG